jgi:uroporphyrinogen-III decarboxylase
VHEVLHLHAEFAARFAENILRQVEVDAVIFSEPIAGNHDSLVSPRMYREYLLNSLAPVFEVLARHHIPLVIWRSYANPRALIPEVARSPFNALWVCEAPCGAMDYNQMRSTLGDGIGLIGGIDSDVLRQGQEDIRSAVRAMLPLAGQGRFIPLADGRVRSDVPYANYAFYRHILEEYFLKPPIETGG